MRLLSTILFVLISLNVYTQSQHGIQLSRPFKVVDAKDKIYLRDGKNILSIKMDSKVLTIQVFNTETMKEVSRKEYKDMPKGASYEDIIALGDKVYYFYSLWDKPNETEQLFVKIINPRNGSFEGKDKLVIKHKGRLTGDFQSTGFYNLSIVNKFTFKYSFDQTKLLIQFRLKPEEKKDEFSFDKIGCYVFDENLDQISGKIVKMPYTEKKMNIGDYSVDSEGNVYTLAYVYKDNSTKDRAKDGSVNYNIELLKITTDSKENTQKIPIILKDKFINNIWMNESPNKTMVCAGFYFNDGKKRSSANGVFICSVDENGEVSESRTYEFPASLINQNMKIKDQKKNDKKSDEEKSELSDLELKDIMIQEDGSVILIGEQFLIVSHTTYDSKGNSRTTYTYHYDNILISKINKLGELVWMEKIPKRQISSSHINGLSYAYVKGENSHYLIYLDNVKNINLSYNEVPAVHRDKAGGFLTAARVDDETGKLDKHSLFDLKNVKGIPVSQFSTDRVIETSTSEFVVEFYKKQKEDIYVKVTLP